jgi:hypothetical protein
MKSLTLIFLSALCFASSEWKSKRENSFVINYTNEDESTFSKYSDWIKEGQVGAGKFFNQKFKQEFVVYVHPNRQSLDEQWQKDWQMPTFKSECWMVASGVATKLDLLSPRVWSSQSCEHNEADLVASKRLIVHELVHVFHGQQNASPDFNATEGIDWFAEGLATYASGQLTNEKLKQIQVALIENKIPLDLNKFWTGSMRYGLSGSMVMYIDKEFGRERLKTLLPFAMKTEILKSLGVTEEKLLADWKKFMETLKV